jgi:dTDP-4-amino-4,6-dideoxygalactose transaminase
MKHPAGTKAKLAIHGGPKVRTTPLPYRKLFGPKELKSVLRVFHESWERGWDFGYQEKEEELYTRSFCDFQGGGYADAVSSGTGGIYLALQALRLKPGSDVVVSPVTDPGGLNPVIVAGFNPVPADAAPGSFNIDPAAFEKAITKNTRAALLTHLGGHPIDMDPIMAVARARGISIIEDCSQAHGAIYKDRKVGCFGELAVFSTMFRKMHATGGCGGLVYTRSEELYWRLRSLADRGKPFNDPKFDLSAPYNPWEFQFAALNFNIDEVACAIGRSTLSRLQATIDARNKIAQKIDRALADSRTVSPCDHRSDCVPSLYFHTVKVDADRLSVSKEEFAKAIAAEGIWINPDYRNVVAEWPWVKKYLAGNQTTPNASDFRRRSFNVLFNEKFGAREIADIIESILKVESHFSR